MGGHSFLGGGGHHHHHGGGHHDGRGGGGGCYGGGGGGGGRINYSPNAPVVTPVIVPPPVIIVGGGGYYPPRYEAVSTTTTTTTTTNNNNTSIYNAPPPPSSIVKREDPSCNCTAYPASKCNAIIIQIILVALMCAYAIVMGIMVPKPYWEEIDLGLSETRPFTFGDSTWYSGFDTGDVYFYDDSTSSSDDRSSNVTLFVFDSMPPLTLNDSWAYTSLLNIPPFSYIYLSWYFFNGSSLEAQWSTEQDPELEVLVIRSVKGYDYYEKGDSKVWEYIVPATLNVIGFDHYLSVPITEDDFYFIIWGSNQTVSGLPVQYSIFTTLLDTDLNYKYSCSLPCSYEICYKCKNDIFIFQTPLVTQYLHEGTPDSVFTFYPTRHTRSWLVAIIFALPLGFMGLVFLILFKCSCASNKYQSVKAIN